MSRSCIKCGKEISGSAAFCRHCGATQPAVPENKPVHKDEPPAFQRREQSRPQPQPQYQEQFRPQPQPQYQEQFRPQPQPQYQEQFRPQPQPQYQEQFRPQPQPQYQEQFRPQPQPQYQEQFNPQPQPQYQEQFRPQPQPQYQEQFRPQPQPQYQEQFDPQYQQQEQYQSRPSSGRKKGIIIAVIAAALALVAAGVLIILNFTVFNNNDFEKPVEYLVNAITEKDPSILEKALPDYITTGDNYSIDDVEEALVDYYQCDEFKTVKYKVVEKNKLADKDLRKTEEIIKDNYGKDVNIKSGYDLVVEFTYEKKDGSTKSVERDISVYEIDGRWCLEDIKV